MTYTLLIYEAPSGCALPADPEQQHAFWAYARALRDAGVHVGGARLQPPETATTVRLRDGQRLVQDGPIADTKEQLGGFLIIDVPDLDAALDLAARCPSASGGVVEVRPNLPLPPLG